MYTTIESMDAYQEVIANEPAALIYFSHEKCNVCKVLKPKIEDMVGENFEQVKLYYVDTMLTPDIAAQQSIFAVPTLLVYFDRREFFRRSRNIGIEELHKEMERPYELMFS